MSVEIGYRLRQARESYGKSLEELEQETRIPAAYLAAIEAGDFESFPSAYFVRTYLRTYALSVGVDPQSILNLYRGTGRTGGRRSRPGRQGRNVTSSPPGYPSYDRQQTSTSSRTRLSRRGKKSPPSSKGGDADSLNRTASHSRTQGVTGEGGKGFTPSEEMAAGHSSSPQSPSGRSAPRRVTMPDDLPEPQEIGLPPRQEHKERAEEEEASRTESLSRHSRVSRTRSQRNNGGKDEKKSRFITWYTRLLIIGAVLLIPATIYVVYLVAFAESSEAPEKDPKQKQDQTESDDGNEAGEAHASQSVSLRPIETEEDGPDRYELSNADQIELKLEAEGECWFQIQGQEVGGKLEDRVLKKGDTFPFTYKDGEELWLEVGRPDQLKVTVNGEKMNTSYTESKKFHITLLK
ncbi:helix-turn-helix domain-containing protein [Paludifilum halophilum]|uniref:helix-turn-helix domain-containing protein n=1 Tax=Paludifilum halophilum TaxID=1642702 RepID=UPI00146AF358|nr:helix-turn-helix domain-containing protein [Paludifilum halophilum]